MIREKARAVGIHFLLSLVVVGSFLVFVYLVWYDQIYAAVFGVIEPIKVLILIDLVLGPFLTLLIYKKGKKGLKMDLGLIVVVQIMAFLYGAYVLFIGKPSLVVMGLHSFEFIIAKDIETEQLDESIAKSLSIMSKPQYGIIPDEKSNMVQLAKNQQAWIEPLKFSDAVLVSKEIKLQDVSIYSDMNSAFIENHLAQGLGVEQARLFIVNFNGEFVMMVVPKGADKPSQIIRNPVAEN